MKYMSMRAACLYIWFAVRIDVQRNKKLLVEEFYYMILFICKGPLVEEDLWPKNN